MTGLAPHTGSIFDAVTKMESIKNYVLVGGTALSMQINNRQSEDLDFMCWRQRKDQKMEVEWRKIEKELCSIGKVEKVDILDIDHVEYLVSGVKLSFYACSKYSPVSASIHLQNNLYLSDIKAIGAMKMEVMMRRSNFRDYYDIYSILKQGIDIQDLIALALEYSEHRMKSKNLLAMLTNGTRFNRDARFDQLQPKYEVTPQDIELYIKSLLNQ